MVTVEIPTYESIGVRPLINCRGTYTIISGSLMLPEVREAMAEVSKAYVHLDELVEAVGARIAELMQCEWGLVTNGCAAALTQVTSACVAGDEPMRHPSFRQPDSILEKLRRFHHDHQTPITCMMEDLHATVSQLPYNTRHHEAQVVAAVLEKQTKRHRGGVALGELLPAVLVRLGINTNESEENRDRS